jgi:hypothetical protein
MLDRPLSVARGEKCNPLAHADDLRIIPLVTGDRIDSNGERHD